MFEYFQKAIVHYSYISVVGDRRREDDVSRVLIMIFIVNNTKKIVFLVALKERENATK